MATNPDFLLCKEERNQEGFFKVLQARDMSSENVRAIPHDFAKGFSDKELLRKMKIRAQWGSSWEVNISKNPRFYFLEKSGWNKFVTDNALGDQEFLTFTHKGKMRFTVKIFNKNGTEMVQPPQSRAFLASSSRVKTDQDVKMEEVVMTSELSHRVPTTVGTSSSSISEFSIYITRSYLGVLGIPLSFADDHMPMGETMIMIHHPDGKQSWNVVYIGKRRQHVFSGGWKKLSKEYPLSIGDLCTFTLVKPKELLLVVSKP